MELWHTLYLEITALLGLVLALITIPWVLMSKKNSTSAVAWCLLVFFLPVVGGSLGFLVEGKDAGSDGGLSATLAVIGGLSAILVDVTWLAREPNPNERD